MAFLPHFELRVHAKALKRFLKEAFVILALMMVVLTLHAQPSWAAGFLPLPTSESLGDVPNPKGEGLQKGYNAVWELARNYRYIIGAVGVLLMTVSGVKMVLQGDNEEAVGKQKTNLVWGAVGLVLIAIAGPISEILDLQDGGFLTDETRISSRAKLFDDQVHILITFIKYILGSITVLFMIRSGALLITEGDSDEVLTAEKKNLLNGGLALFIIIISDVVVKQVLFKVDTDQANYSTSGQEAIVEIDTARGVQEIVGITNFVVTWAAPFAVLALIVGGVMYIAAFGDEELTGKAKKIIVNSMIALLIIYGAFALVSTFISGVF